MSTAHYIRNGALTGIGLYLLVTIPFLGLSLQTAQGPQLLPALSATLDSPPRQLPG